MTRADLIGLGWAATTGGLALGLGPSWATLGLPTAAAALLLADGVARPASSLIVPTLSRLPGAGPRVALTFDDGPDPRWTPAVARLLEGADARATFFQIGRHVHAHPDLTRDLAAAGHELGNHSHTHARTLNFRSAKVLTAEITRGEETLRAAGATPPPGASRLLYRPPIGLRNPALARVARRLDLTVVNWSVRSLDTRIDGGPAIARRVLSRVGPGDIILLHDGCDRPGADRSDTLDALPRILDGLAARGLEPVTVSRLRTLATSAD